MRGIRCYRRAFRLDRPVERLVCTDWCVVPPYGVGRRASQPHLPTSSTAGTRGQHR